MAKISRPRIIFSSILVLSILLSAIVQYNTFRVTDTGNPQAFRQILNDTVRGDVDGVEKHTVDAARWTVDWRQIESEIEKVRNTGVSANGQERTIEGIDVKIDDNVKIDIKKIEKKENNPDKSVSLNAQEDDTKKANDNQVESKAEKAGESKVEKIDESIVEKIVESKAENVVSKVEKVVEPEAKKVVDEIEECPCPDQKKMRKVLRGLEIKCRITNCNEYKVDISTLEKPASPFHHYDKVVIATKVHWPKDLASLQQMVCVFNAAYNRHAGYYDIVVFSTLPWSEFEVKALQGVAQPANLTVVVDSPPLEDVLALMTEEEVRFLKKRCKCAYNETLTWFHHCTEEQGDTVNVGYSWQSEFRAYHLWKEPVLEKYKYMIWMDSDALATKMWDIDPMKLMVENDLVVMFDNIRGSTHRDVIPKLMQAYNQSICNTKITDEGYFKATHCSVDKSRRSSKPLIHGFHHITNMDFYRSERTMHFLKLMVGDYKFSRKFDDQMAVTLPALMDAGNRSWSYDKKGLNFEIFHNGKQDGRKKVRYNAYHRFHWRENRYKWEAGTKICSQWITEGG